VRTAFHTPHAHATKIVIMSDQMYVVQYYIMKAQIRRGFRGGGTGVCPPKSVLPEI